MSNILPFRTLIPSRTYTGVKLSPYNKYKQHLIIDFRNRCGYCGSVDFWFGGTKTFHIDHFAPKSLFPDIECAYENLIYACAYCNRAKSNDWPSDNKEIAILENKGYINPCSNEYDEQFSRSYKGAIIPKTEVAIYMHKKLKLYLERNRIIWTLDMIHQKIEEITLEIDQQQNSEVIQELKEVFYELSREFFKYLKYLKSEIS